MNKHKLTLGDLQNQQKLDLVLSQAFVNQPHLMVEVGQRFAELGRFHDSTVRPSPGATSSSSTAALEAMLIHVPGRIEVLGKHTDYAGGLSLTSASHRSLLSVVTSHPSPSLIISDSIRGIQIELPYDNPQVVEGQSWSTYIVAVLGRLIRHYGIPTSGVSISLASNLPSASGMSSSSGLVISIALALLGKGG